MAQEPNAPESIPQYISDGLPKQGGDTLLDVIDYCEELLGHRADHEPEIPDDAEIVEDNADERGGTIVEEMVACGKDSCHCASGGELHGPYEYRYWSEDGTSKSEYLGKVN